MEVAIVRRKVPTRLLAGLALGTAFVVGGAGGYVLKSQLPLNPTTPVSTTTVSHYQPQAPFHDMPDTIQIGQAAPFHDMPEGG